VTTDSRTTGENKAQILLARQTILDVRREIAGYELLFRSREPRSGRR
jgi:hypothetical protein